MKKVKLPIQLLATSLAMLALVVGLAFLGSNIAVSQEEEPDECAVVFEPDEEWSAQAYAYCTIYCSDLDCDGTPAPENEEQCLAMVDQYADATGGGIPPCEPQP